MTLLTWRPFYEDETDTGPPTEWVADFGMFRAHVL